ncbi:MAG: acyl-CoA desaturase, partial [Planctomycetota bacterium]
MPSAPATSARPHHLVKTSIFLGFHVAAGVLAYLAGLPSVEAVLLAVGMYFARMFVVTAGYHRYFSHRTFKTSRAFQFLLALGAMTTLQKGVLWWAAHHRHHHRFSDQPEDLHSPRRGFWWAHVGWILSDRYTETRYDKIKDFAKYPELRFFNSELVMVLTFAALCAAFYFGLGFQALVYGCFVSTVFLWHGTFTINSLTHLVGKRVYATSDDSRNSLILALITLGEGWHNNHHYYQTAACQGFRWYEIDITYAILRLLEKLGIVWDLRGVPAEVVDGRLGGRNWLVREVGDQGPGRL